MNFDPPLVEGVIVDRRKRFLADVRLPDGTEVVAHLANTGRMTGCWEPNGACRLSKSDNPKRKLAWSVEQCRVGDRWVLVNTARPNRIVEEALRDGRFGLSGDVRREVAFPDGGRADFRVGRTWVEVKSVTLKAGDDLLFPDTVSVRAREHLARLTAAVMREEPAWLLLLVGTTGGSVVRPAWHLDPEWAEALEAAVAAGVVVTAVRAVFDARGAVVGASIPVDGTDYRAR